MLLFFYFQNINKKSFEITGFISSYMHQILYTALFYMLFNLDLSFFRY